MIWLYAENGLLMEVPGEEFVQILAEDYKQNIYFFAELITEDFRIIHPEGECRLCDFRREDVQIEVQPTGQAIIRDECPTMMWCDACMSRHPAPVIKHVKTHNQPLDIIEEKK